MDKYLKEKIRKRRKKGKYIFNLRVQKYIEKERKQN